MNQRKSEAINLRMTPELKELLRLAAERERRTLSIMLAVLILDYCYQHGLTAGGSAASRASASGVNKTKQKHGEQKDASIRTGYRHHPTGHRRHAARRPSHRERRYVAPFARANREDDYRTAWTFFEENPA